MHQYSCFRQVSCGTNRRPGTSNSPNAPKSVEAQRRVPQAGSPRRRSVEACVKLPPRLLDYPRGVLACQVEAAEEPFGVGPLHGQTADQERRHEKRVEVWDGLSSEAAAEATVFCEHGVSPGHLVTYQQRLFEGGRVNGRAGQRDESAFPHRLLDNGTLDSN